jgi:hypothetical protein
LDTYLFLPGSFYAGRIQLSRSWPNSRQNTINAVIKNTVDFPISVIGFGIIGFSVMLGESLSGVIGKPFSLSTTEAPHIYLIFIFQAMFCALPQRSSRAPSPNGCHSMAIVWWPYSWSYWYTR